jgi:hypothetical protein
MDRKGRKGKGREGKKREGKRMERRQYSEFRLLLPTPVTTVDVYIGESK